MTQTYILCSTPRTGSTLLCELLKSSGVAGKPHSYFRLQDMNRRAKEWGILRSDGSYDFCEFLTAARKFGSTANGVLGLRIMWGTLEEVIDELTKIFPDTPNNDLELLETAFGKIKFVYLRRKDVVAQSISLYRAERTNYWHSTEGLTPQMTVEYDSREIASRTDMLNEHNRAWQNWFRKAGVTPLEICYEDLETDPETVTLKVLEFLDLSVPEGTTLNAPNKRLADETNRSWKERFESE